MEERLSHYERPEIKKVRGAGKRGHDILMAPEHASSESWTGSCCYKGRTHGENRERDS